MAASGQKETPSIGFLTVCRRRGVGLLGGYLVLNLAGRPLEFHCTAPVRPSRAQEILYGPTLKPYLYGEQIGQALLRRTKPRPALVFTDVVPALAVRDFVPCPVVFVPPKDADAQASAPAPMRTDAAHGELPSPHAIKLHRFSIGDQQLAVPRAHAEDQHRVVERWQPDRAGFDLWEPFGRIRDAIDEACRSAR